MGSLKVKKNQLLYEYNIEYSTIYYFMCQFSHDFFKA